MLRQRLMNELNWAMKDRNARKVATLRLILAAIKDRDIMVRTTENREGVTDDEILQILTKMVRQRQDSIKAYEEAGRLELAEQEREEIDIIESFLPRQLSDEEIRAACRQVIDETGATSLKDMGRAMCQLKERYAGRMDFTKASAMVRDQLS